MNAESERLREAGWDSFVVKLRSEHYVARVTTYAAPLQLEGCLPTGESFYFRARWNACTLRVSRDSPELGSNWHDTVELAGEYSASYLEPGEGEAVFRALVLAYLERPRQG